MREPDKSLPLIAAVRDFQAARRELPWNCSAMMTAANDLSKALEAYEAQPSAIATNTEANAARYEWLRSKTGADSHGFRLPYPQLHEQVWGKVNLLKGSVAQHLDKAIDDAMASVTSDGTANGS